VCKFNIVLEVFLKTFFLDVAKAKLLSHVVDLHTINCPYLLSISIMALSTLVPHCNAEVLDVGFSMMHFC
jgi:hypothetical protein